jgi:hypothetical protein
MWEPVAKIIGESPPADFGNDVASTGRKAKYGRATNRRGETRDPFSKRSKLLCGWLPHSKG